MKKSIILKNTDEIIKKIVRFPMHNKLNVKEVDYICKKVKDYFRK